MIPIFVGYDPKEAIAYHVFCQSITTRTKARVSFTPVTGEQRDGSNAFIYERFLVPWMCDYKGWAIFADGDMICRGDIEELWNLRSRGYDVMVAKHDYKTKHPVKYLGQKNEDYPRKNWSSLMLIDCANFPWHNVDPKTIKTMTGKELHRFEFLDEDRIGDLPLEWNWLVSEYAYNQEAKIAHFTIGTPCWPEYRNCDYADEWRKERDAMLYFQPGLEKAA
jgi:lipopolysaccharide biosynthesis glycosyltransferase